MESQNNNTTSSKLGLVAKTTPNYISQIHGALSLTELLKMKNDARGHRAHPVKGTIDVICKQMKKQSSPTVNRRQIH